MGLRKFFFGLPDTPRTVKTARGRQVSRFKKEFMPREEFQNWTTKTHAVELPYDILTDRTKFLAQFFKILQYIPSVSGSIWAWKWIVFTDQNQVYVGGSNQSQQKAKKIIEDFDQRISPSPYLKGSGILALAEQFFQSIFAYGRFASETIISPTFDEISSVDIIDGFDVYFKKDKAATKAFVKQPKQDHATEMNPATFFYYGLNADTNNPYGSAMLEAATPFIEIAEEMMQDMRHGSHNAGVPRLHIKVQQPPIMETEDVGEYENRINDYFNGTVKEMSEIGPDDNFYTWDDVAIAGVTGSSGPGAFVWKSNRAVVDEEIITAFHLYPWILGKSTGTTKNWVTAQYNIILSQATSFQMTAKNYLEWLMNLELKLHGITDVVVQQKFTRPRDPAAKDLSVAEKFNISNVNTLVRSGYISPDDAARRLGLDKAYDPNRIYKVQKKGKPNGTEEFPIKVT